MKIDLNRINDAFHFEARNEAGHIVNIDSAPAIGGENKGVRPMQLLLMGLGSCSSIDIGLILRKQKQEIKNFKVSIEGQREKDKTPALFETININFSLEGSLNPEKVRRAVELSMDKYCSVARILERSADISYSIIVNGEQI